MSFYDDQMTHHAAALTYYALMSLFPAVLLALSLLGLLGQYPETYNAIIGYLREVAPASVVDPLDRSLRGALQSKGTAATALAISVVVALYGTTGALEAARRALNVVFEVESGRSFLRRKTIDVASTFVLMALVLVSLVMAFVGGRFAEDLLGFIGLGSTTAHIWNVARWPGAVATAMLVFALIYYITPDVQQRSFRWVTPGRGGRGAALARRVLRLVHLRLQGRRRRRDLRHLRGRHSARRLALAHQRRAATRRRAERGDRARAGRPHRGGAIGLESEVAGPATWFACGAGALPLNPDQRLEGLALFLRARTDRGTGRLTMPTRRSHSAVDRALRRRGGLNRADGNRRVGRTIAARRQLAAREVSYSRDKDMEDRMATLGQEHDRAERRLRAALADQRRSNDRYDAAVGRSARLVAAMGLHVADQAVAARDAWLRWVDDDGYRGLNAGPFELRAGRSGP